MSSSEGIFICFSKKKGRFLLTDMLTLAHWKTECLNPRHETKMTESTSLFFRVVFSLLLYLTLFPLYNFRFCICLATRFLSIARFVAFIFNFLLFWICENRFFSLLTSLQWWSTVTLCWTHDSLIGRYDVYDFSQFSLAYIFIVSLNTTTVE